MPSEEVARTSASIGEARSCGTCWTRPVASSGSRLQTTDRSCATNSAERAVCTPSGSPSTGCAETTSTSTLTPSWPPPRPGCRSSARRRGRIRSVSSRRSSPCAGFTTPSGSAASTRVSSGGSPPQRHRTAARAERPLRTSSGRCASIARASASRHRPTSRNMLARSTLPRAGPSSPPRWPVAADPRAARVRPARLRPLA